MTEDDAKTKWCPFARAPVPSKMGDLVPGSPVVNRRDDGSADGASLCLGSACMAWRVLSLPTDTVHGYCGLAGGQT